MAARAAVLRHHQRDELTMAKQDQPRVQVDARDFPGIQLADDANDLEPGEGQDQMNAKSDQVGSMRVRLGCLPISFDL